ncbi:hypothetical protein PT285_04280 [Lactobacillus sp. ESL0791]|uniref:hypothetical protein n=1 Tax=Lactobacillus sp. ESL0791 TaxID=2983234 RepID=UPI0023F64FBF|nr:hypothetical protein [Lactobacillus sp. ESL0791]MDF7638616.1 hypothetical protein [Lactobacillus sp. ESL0791]
MEEKRIVIENGQGFTRITTVDDEKIWRFSNRQLPTPLTKAAFELLVEDRWNEGNISNDFISVIDMQGLNQFWNEYSKDIN